MLTLYDAMLAVHYGFAWVFTDNDGYGPDVDLMVTRSGQTNGLCGAAVPGLLSLVTGLHTGEVPFQVRWHPSEPEIEAEWDDVVEVSLDIAAARGALTAFEESHELALPATGPHRVRYCAIGMDAAREQDLAIEDRPAPDRYLLDLWPAPRAADAVLKQTSETAAYWHDEARAQPALSPEELAEVIAAAPTDDTETGWLPFHNDRTQGQDEDQVREALNWSNADDTDSALLEHLAKLDPADQRHAARWFVYEAFEIAGIRDADWVQPALEAMAAGRPLPPPFDDRRGAFARLAQEDQPLDEKLSIAYVEVRSAGSPKDDLTRIHRPSFALPTMFAAVDANPLVAARASFEHAAATFNERKPELIGLFWHVFDPAGHAHDR